MNEIKHSIPERIRFKVYAIRFDKDASFGLEKYFRSIKGIKWVKANPQSASLVIRHDKEILTTKDIVSIVIKLYPQHVKSIPIKETGIVKEPLHEKKKTLKLSLLSFLGLSFLTIVVFVREVLIKKPLAQNFLSPLGLITAGLAIPLVKKGFKDIKSRRFTLETFLGASIVTAVIAGKALLDESSITGRAEPVLRTKDEKVFAGTFVRQGVIFVEAEHVGDKTYLSHILQMVEDFLENKAEIQTVADRFATPVAVKVSMYTAAREGVLLKGSSAIDSLEQVDTVIFDKTGTLTRGVLEVVDVVPLGKMEPDELLALAASAEEHYTHPVANAVARAASRQGLVLPETGKVDSIDEIYWELSPEDKAEIVENLKNQGHFIAFVGDGVNDAPAMVTSDVAICMPSGAELAKESSEVILLKDDLSLLVTAREIACNTRQTIKDVLILHWE